MWSDLNGLSHGRYVPVRRIHEHTHHAVTTLTMNVLGDILEVPGYSADVGYPDLSTVPVPDSRRPGWEPETDVVVADLEYHHEPLELSPRAALQKSVDAWRAMGYEPMLGFEMEFYVMQRDASAPGGYVPLDRPSHRVYGVGIGGDVYTEDAAGNRSSLMFDIFDAAEHCELDLEGVAAEFSPAQMELNMKYGPAMDAADRAFISRDMVRELADRKGLGITFMGRPIGGPFTGNGLHINFSLVPVGSTSNAFDDPSAEFGISTLARQCMGGMIAHHEAMALMSAPTVNSYKRLMPGIIAGYWANWGLDNRISTYRIPGERGAATRIENRMPCGTANVYLAAAVMLEAARLGVVNGIDCGAPQEGNGDVEPNTDRHTPHSLAEAVAAFEADAELRATMGHDLSLAYLTIRRNDLERWEAAGVEWDPDTISNWELSNYLPYY
jgi:glutamine synthetase